jgi:hypothetical protein
LILNKIPNPCINVTDSRPEPHTVSVRDPWWAVGYFLATFYRPFFAACTNQTPFLSCVSKTRPKFDCSSTDILRLQKRTERPPAARLLKRLSFVPWSRDVQTS